MIDDLVDIMPWTGCQDLIYPMYSTSMSIGHHCLLFTPLGPDHPWSVRQRPDLPLAARVFPLGGTPFSVSGLASLFQHCTVQIEGKIWFLETLEFTVVVIGTRGISGVTIHGI